jgi:ABC-type dipeptide/oligopeptide/nickel transport system permease component
LPGYIARRALFAVFVLLGVTLVTFVLLHVIPGDAASLAAGRSATGQQIAAMRAHLGLNKPLPIQYLVYVTNLLHGDLGTSPFTHRPILSDILDVLPASLELVIAAMILNICIALPLGVLAAVHEGGRLDGFVRLLVMVSAGIPVFWLGLMLQLGFASQLHIFPLIGQVSFGEDVGARITGLVTLDALLQGRWSVFVDAVNHLILPAITLATLFIAVITRTTRSTMLASLRQDYIILARAKGLSERRIIIRHALRNAMIPNITILGLQVGWMMGSTVLVEGIFARPGIGSYAVRAIQQKDLWAVMGVVLIVSVIFVVANLLVDLAYSWLNPKLRVGAY